MTGVEDPRFLTTESSGKRIGANDTFVGRPAWSTVGG